MRLNTVRGRVDRWECRTPNHSPRRGQLRIYVVTRRFIDTDLTQGCMLGRLATETADSDQLIREFLDKVFEGWERCIAMTLERAQAAGETELAMPADRLAGVIISLWEGALIRARVARSSNPLREFSTTVFEHLVPAIVAEPRGDVCD